MQGNISLLTLTIAAAGALAEDRFVTQAGAYPAAGGKSFGVTRTSASAEGDLVPCDVLGTAIVEAGAAFAKDADLQSDASGRAIALTVGAKHGVARAMQAATAAGQKVEVLLLPSNGIPTAAS
ncbi:MAG: DUF2190 family protein [Burkholderiales bacterium]|nr:DUF2190 family protein [Burkholderiales bacterium]